MLHCTVANVHINNECAKWRSVCIALLLLIRDLCMELFAVILTGDLNKGARISPLEAAFSCAMSCCQLLEVTPLLGRGGEPHGCMWPECCGFVVLPASQNQWLITRHGSINLVPQYHDREQARSETVDTIPQRHATHLSSS